MPDFPCRICGTPIQPRSWHGGECGRCGSVCVTVLPSPQELSDYYARFVDEYSGGGSSGGSNMIRYAKVYQAHVQRIAGPPGTGRRVLDVGSSNNPFPNVMAQGGDAVQVIDYVRPHALDEGVVFVPGHLGDTTLFTGFSEQFDVVTCWAVLEHVPEPKLAVKNLCTATRRGGFVLVSTPEIGTALTGSSVGHSRWFFPPEHLNLISPQAMRAMFEAEGFKPLAWGRVELSPLRYLARYGIGLAETLIGAAVKLCAPPVWQRWREQRRHRFQGITWFAFQAPRD